MHLASPITLQPYGTVPTLDDAMELAGPGALHLADLSRQLGSGGQLVLALDTRTVFWADEQPDGQWIVEELTADQALLRLPARCGHEAPHEYRLLLRATLDQRSSTLPGHIDQLIRDCQDRIAHLSAVREELVSA
ncbi:hypothetical protein P3T36_004533 [Kitasatospora sp. MAP12-15]|uniref:hypothetical protein n=1 Tax=unclassified Kitasatospora TaxID=2633591 RepID=UPI0024766695|nr:hypothetical protein [Kitasatospora sp. MAP12-44]MDH6111379.1 hypothetical protein [Kitasatospora sp. MAP12-44]